jgi:hypothetical protein
MHMHKVLIRASLIAFVLMAGPAVGQPAATDPAYDDDEFTRQMSQVEKEFPLVARGFGFLQELFQICNVDESCFRALQNQCLRDGLPPRFCFESSRRACCKPPVLQPPEPFTGPTRILDATDVRVLDPGRGGSTDQCTSPRPPDIGCSRICKPCVTSVCVDGEWERVDIDFPDGFCDRGPMDPPFNTCPRTGTGFCPAECHLCF